jgi:tetratricopeptide (TPR) repeat protein
MRELNYLDFDLVVERAGPGTYRARVTDAPAGETAPAQFAVPFSDLEIDNFLLRIGRPRRAPVRGEQSMEAAAVRDFGGRLFDAVFRDELRVALATSLDRAESRDAGLRLRLRFSDAPELADLPWEYLYDRGARRFLALSEWTPVVRYLEFPGRVRPLAVQPPLRVLVLIASPSDFPGLDVDAEWEKLNEALGDLQRAGRVEVHRMPTGTLADLQRQLRRNDYHVFHFVGHGGYDAQADDGVLVLEGANRRGQQVSGQDLGVLLHDHRTLRLAVLNSCEGARGGRTDPYSGTAQSLVRQGIPAVVAMQFEITDTAAITLTRSLYEAVADGYPLDAAMAEARKAVRHEPNPVEWGTPVLYLRAPDGRIFNLPAGSSLAGAADSTTPRASVATAETIIEPSDDPDYTAALAAYFTERWDTAVELFTRVLAKYPEHRPAAERLAEAQRHQQLAQWDTEAREAAEQGHWEVAVAALERLHAAQPDRSDVQQQLEHARTQEKIAALQADLRHMYDARQWQAVIVVGEQLAKIDPQLADQDGLVTSAKAELAEEALADRYRAGLRQLDRDDRAAAAANFAAILEERPDYRDAAALLARTREDAPAQTAEAQEPPPQPEVPATPPPSETPTTDQATLDEQSQREAAEQARPSEEQLLTATGAAEADAGTGIPAGKVEGAEGAEADQVGLGSASGGPGPAWRRRWWVWGLAALAVMVAVVVAIGQILGSDELECTQEAATGSANIPASFETGTEGWQPIGDTPDAGCTSQSSDDATDGDFSLRIDNARADGAFYGVPYDELGEPIDITGATELSVDMKGLDEDAPTAIAVQFFLGTDPAVASDDEWAWCESPNWVPAGELVEAGTVWITVTLDLDFETMNCGAAEPTSSDLAEVQAMWVWIGGTGSFWIDNVRAE